MTEQKKLEAVADENLDSVLGAGQLKSDGSEILKKDKPKTLSTAEIMEWDNVKN